MGIGPELAGGMLGAGLGAALSPSGNPDSLMDAYNSVLNKALKQAIDSSTQYTQQAKDQLKQSLGVAEGAIQTGQQQANQGLFNTTRSAFNLGQGLLTPYRNAGYASQDALMASLGMATPAGGSINQANQQAATQQLELLRQQYGGVPSEAASPGAAPVFDQFLQQTPTQNLGAYLNQNQSKDKIGNATVTIGGKTYKSNYGWRQDQLDEMNQALKEQTAREQFNAAQADYNSKNQAYQNYQNYQNAQNAISQQYPYQTAPQGGPAQSQSGLSGLLNSTGYQSLFGTQIGQNVAQGGAYDPVQAFKQDPGYQYAIDEALKAVNQQGAAKGLLESGGLQQELLRTAQGIQNQRYGQYQDRLSGLFSNYQNQLAGLTQLGSGLTGANTAAQLFSNMGNQQAQYNYGTGTQLAQANLGTGGDIASLLANQGVLNANAYLNTGAAKASGLMQNAGLTAQVNANTLASNAQTNASQNMSNAYMQAAGMFGYNPNQQNVSTAGNPWGFGSAKPGTIY